MQSNANQFTVMPSLDMTKCMWYQGVSPTVDQEQFYILLDKRLTNGGPKTVLYLAGYVGTYRTILSPLDKPTQFYILLDSNSGLMDSSNPILGFIMDT